MSAAVRLSEAQSRIIEHRGCDLQIIACAGAGKTEAVSRRVAGLLAEGVEPEAIVAFTFTEKAGAELKDRIYRRCEELLGLAFLDRLGPMLRLGDLARRTQESGVPPRARTNRGFHSAPRRGGIP